MTSDIMIWEFREIKPNSVKWKCSVSNFIDTCSITLPLTPYIRNNKENSTVFSKKASIHNTAFREGDKVEVSLGYDNKNLRRFKGFIRRINYAKPLVLECEGYSYQLKDVIFTKSYQRTTVLAILQDLIVGTDIKLSKYIPDIPLSNVTFSKTPGLKVLEWFQKECLCAVFFDFDELYVGASKYSILKPTIKLEIGWNTVEDKELKKDINDTKIIINLVEKSAGGAVKRTKSVQRKYTTTKDVKIRPGLPDSFLKQVANELQKLENFSGYTGDITCFLIPNFEKACIVDLRDTVFPDRNGLFFVESVEGSYDQSGGRQKLTLRYYGEVDRTGG